MDEMTPYSGYDSLVKSIGTLLDAARSQIATSVNTILVKTYWNIGKYIVEFEQGGALSAEYGSNLLNRLSTDLTHLYGKGFSRSNILYMRKFYVCFPKSETLSHVLSWSHFSRQGGKGAEAPRNAEGRGAGEGMGGNGDVRGPVQGAVPRMRHDGVCLTTVRLATARLKGRSILRLFQVFFEKSEEKVFPSTHRGSLWIFIALIGASRPWPRGYPWFGDIVRLYENDRHSIRCLCM